jgi:hypothetical protein
VAWFFLNQIPCIAIETPEMLRKILTAMGLIAFVSLSHAQTACELPAQPVTIFFGNGIAVTKESARDSLSTLRFAIGDNYNGQKIGYKLAYNKTSGIAEDLLQSALQAQIQWDSQVMGWLKNIGVAPDWFNTWHQKFLSSFSTVLASELPEHVAQFSSELMRGKKCWWSHTHRATFM